MLVQRPLLASSAYIYTFQSCDKMLHFMLAGYRLLCLPGECWMFTGSMNRAQCFIFSDTVHAAWSDPNLLLLKFLLLMWCNLFCSATMTSVQYMETRVHMLVSVLRLRIHTSSMLFFSRIFFPKHQAMRHLKQGVKACATKGDIPLLWHNMLLCI